MLIVSILGILFVVISMVLSIWGKYQMKKKAMQYSAEAKEFYERLKQLADPDHFFTDEELQQLKDDYKPLLKNINHLYKSPFLSKSYLDDLGLNEFVDYRRLLNHIQYKNNQNYRKEHPSGE